MTINNNEDRLSSTNTKGYLHQELLCSIKLHNSGMLEVNPGFSNKEAEDSDDDIFVSSVCLQKSETKGIKLSTFSFATSAGSVYQYALEWIDYIVDPNKLENLALREVDEHYRLLSQHRKNLLWQIDENNTPIDSLTCTEDEKLIQIQLISAFGFHPKWDRSSLSIEYHITIPNQADSVTGSTMGVAFDSPAIMSFRNNLGFHIIIIACLLELVSSFILDYPETSQQR